MRRISRGCGVVTLGIRRAESWFAGALACLWIVSGACAIPGRLYPVAPAVLGELRGAVEPGAESELRLSVTSREVPTLFEVQRVRLSQNGSFRFDPVKLAVAGREYSKVYHVYLYYRVGTRDRVIWRAEFSRRDVTGSIELDCDLDRPARLGQPCWVRDPLEHRWLVVNGERTFDRLCSECHGRSGRGDRSTGSALLGVAPDLTQIATRRSRGFDRIEVAEWIEGSLIPREHGPQAMPVWGERLSAENWRFANADELVGATLDPLVVFLLSIQEE